MPAGSDAVCRVVKLYAATGKVLVAAVRANEKFHLSPPVEKFPLPIGCLTHLEDDAQH